METLIGHLSMVKSKTRCDIWTKFWLLALWVMFQLEPQLGTVVQQDRLLTGLVRTPMAQQRAAMHLLVLAELAHQFLQCSTEVQPSTRQSILRPSLTVATQVITTKQLTDLLARVMQRAGNGKVVSHLVWARIAAFRLWEPLQTHPVTPILEYTLRPLRTHAKPIITLGLR